MHAHSRAAQSHAVARTHRFKLDFLDFGRRMAVEREIDSTPAGTVAPCCTVQRCTVLRCTVQRRTVLFCVAAPPTSVTFDDSGHFICYATMLG